MLTITAVRTPATIAGSASGTSLRHRLTVVALPLIAEVVVSPAHLEVPLTASRQLGQ